MRMGGIASAILGLLMVLLAMPAAAEARAVPLREACHATGSLAESVEAIAADSARWNCTATGWDHAPESTVVRFELAGDGAVPPASFVSRIGRFSRIAITAIDADGARRSRAFAMGDARALAEGPYFALPLPEIRADTRTVLVRIDHPWARNILADARLSATSGGDGWAHATGLVIAAICGLLLAPLAFNFAFYRVLRERFVLWHSLIVLGMLGQALVGSGLIHAFGAVPLALAVPLMSVSFSIAVAAAALFTADFIEPGKLSPRMDRMLRASAPLTIALGVLCSISIDPLRGIAMQAYYLWMLPMMALFTAAMAQAWRNRSRMVLFQVIGWAPSLLVGVVRIFTNVSVAATPSDAHLAYNAAIAFEVVVTALGVANRFMAIRRDRDIALDRAERMQGEAARDPLTGLLNRRGIEERFTQLRALGFNAVAVIDLDHFKAINDRMGHHVGDRVLAAAAQALQPDRDLLAFRMGGEEFMLVLRGPEALRRAEARRQAITARAAVLVQGLPGPVTASMGLIEFPPDARHAVSFHEAYARADALLYEAKHAGRNRTASERLTLFQRRTAAG